MDRGITQRPVRGETITRMVRLGERPTLAYRYAIRDVVMGAGVVLAGIIVAFALPAVAGGPAHSWHAGGAGLLGVGGFWMAWGIAATCWRRP